MSQILDEALPQSCQEARQALLDGPIDATAFERVQAHRARCGKCTTECAQLKELVSNVQASGTRLDDLTRARMQARLGLQLDNLASRSARPRALMGQMWRAVILGLPLAAAAALLLVLWPLAPQVSQPPAAPTLPPPVGAPAAPLAQLRLHHGADSRSTDHLVVPEGRSIRASLATRANITLVGPAELQVVDVVEGQITLDLAYGLLIGDYDHSAGGMLRIHTPTGVAEVVGTLFAVHAEVGRTKVSVSHGKVRVRGAETPSAQIVHGGQTWSSANNEVAAVDPDDSRVMAVHEARGEIVEPPASVSTLPMQADPVQAPPVQAPAVQAAPVQAARVQAAPAQAAPVQGPPVQTAPVHAGSAQALTTAEHPTAQAAPPKASEPRAEAEAPAPPARATAPQQLALAPRQGLPEAAARPAVPSMPSTAPVAALAPSTPNSAPNPLPQVETPPSEAPAAPTPAAPPAPQALYAAAETAMARRDHEQAKRALTELVRLHPNHALADTARYELLLRTLKDGSEAEAKQWADQLVAHGRNPMLVESARFTQCQLAVAAQTLGKAKTCFESFRQAHPRSARDSDALGNLVLITAKLQGCTQALPQVRGYLRLYPNGAHAKRAAEIERACAAPLR